METVEISSNEWTDLEDIPYEGSKNKQIKEFSVVASRGGNKGNAYLRVWDKNNSKQVAIVIKKSEEEEKLSQHTIEFLPRKESVFVLQSKVDSGADSVKLYSYNLG